MLYKEIVFYYLFTKMAKRQCRFDGTPPKKMKTPQELQKHPLFYAPCDLTSDDEDVELEYFFDEDDVDEGYMSYIEINWENRYAWTISPRLDRHMKLHQIDRMLWFIFQKLLDKVNFAQFLEEVKREKLYIKFCRYGDYTECLFLHLLNVGFRLQYSNSTNLIVERRLKEHRERMSKMTLYELSVCAVRKLDNFDKLLTLLPKPIVQDLDVY